MPGSWFVPVSFQSHALAPPGKSLASLKGPSIPSTSRRPHERWVTLGERASCSILPPHPPAVLRLASGRVRWCVPDGLTTCLGGLGRARRGGTRTPVSPLPPHEP